MRKPRCFPTARAWLRGGLKPSTTDHKVFLLFHADSLLPQFVLFSLIGKQNVKAYWIPTPVFKKDFVVHLTLFIYSEINEHFLHPAGGKVLKYKLGIIQGLAVFP
jgi:hypothetical protein